MHVFPIDCGIIEAKSTVPGCNALDPDQEVTDLRARLVPLDLNQDGFLGDRTLCPTEEITNESER